MIGSYHDDEIWNLTQLCSSAYSSKGRSLGSVGLIRSMLEYSCDKHLFSLSFIWYWQTNWQITLWKTIADNDTHIKGKG